MAPVRDPREEWLRGAEHRGGPSPLRDGRLKATVPRPVLDPESDRQARCGRADAVPLPGPVAPISGDGPSVEGAAPEPPWAERRPASRRPAPGWSLGRRGPGGAGTDARVRCTLRAVGRAVVAALEGRRASPGGAGRRGGEGGRRRGRSPEADRRRTRARVRWT